LRDHSAGFDRRIADRISPRDIAFIGGSIASHGGHNVLEPAVEGVCVITGPHTDNFAAIIQTLLGEGALVQLGEVRDFGSRKAAGGHPQGTPGR
jgi:3-deoxy-D-manno-octulosonic-acid transferase